MTERAPLLWTAVFFAAGILLQWIFTLPFFLIASGAGIAGAVLWKVRKAPRAANLTFLALISLLGACRAEMDARQAPNDIVSLISSSPSPIAVKGTLVNDPRWTSHYRALSGWLEVEAVRDPGEWRAASGRLFVRWPWRAGRWECGDRLQLHGRIRAGRAASSGHRFDEGRWLWVHRGEGILSVSAVEGVRWIDRSTAAWAVTRRAIARFRERLMGLGRSLMGPVEAAFLEALVLGQQQEIPLSIQEVFRKTGTIHVLVVSGSNVGLIGLMALMLLSFLRVPRGMRYALLAGILWTYCILTGLSPPILRATLMGILLCWGAGQGLEVSPLNLVGAAACLIQTVHPRALADVSFQLSFSAVLGILAAAKGFSTREPEARWGQWLKAGGKALAVSTAAWAATAPFLWWHFQQVSLLAPLANLVVVPWASGLMAAGLLVYAAALFIPALAVPFASSFSFLAQGLARVVTWLAEGPW